MGRHWSLEEREKIGLRMKEVWRTKRKGWKHSEVTKEKLRQKSKMQFIQRPELRELSKKIATDVLQSRTYEKACETCGKPLVFRRKFGAFCSSLCTQTWYRKMWYGREYTDHRRREYNNYHPKVVNSERLIANEVLPRMGFTDIFLTRETHALFPFDILGKKDEDRYGILVTTKYNLTRSELEGLSPLIQFFGIRVLIFFVKPDLTFYTYREYNPHERKRGTLSAIGEYLQFIKARKH